MSEPVRNDAHFCRHGYGERPEARGSEHRPPGHQIHYQLPSATYLLAYRFGATRLAETSAGKPSTDPRQRGPTGGHSTVLLPFPTSDARSGAARMPTTPAVGSRMLRGERKLKVTQQAAL